MKWIRVTQADNIPVRQGRSVKLGSYELAIFNLGGGFRAVESRCPHRGGPLADGIVAGDDIICPLHNWRLSTRLVLRARLPGVSSLRRF
jgi:nitrite reductase (NADH) small subunit